TALRAADLGGLAVSIRRGGDSYITGEETALLEALEGRRPLPRPEPPPRRGSARRAAAPGRPARGRIGPGHGFPARGRRLRVSDRHCRLAGRVLRKGVLWAMPALRPGQPQPLARDARRGI